MWGLRRTIRYMPQCLCCHMENAIFSPRKQFNGLPMASIVCDLCAKHQGSDAHDLKKAAVKHFEIWEEHERERVESITQDSEVKLTARTSEIERLQQELKQRPVQVVEKWVGADELDEAREFASRAYSSREHAFRQLCLIHINHHELPGEKCRCGKSVADCDVVGILEGYTALRRWERSQEERRDRGQSHELPYEYVRSLGLRAHEDDPREFDAFGPGEGDDAEVVTRGR